MANLAKEKVAIKGLRVPPHARREFLELAVQLFWTTTKGSGSPQPTSTSGAATQVGWLVGRLVGWWFGFQEVQCIVHSSALLFLVDRHSLVLLEDRRLVHRERISGTTCSRRWRSREAADCRSAGNRARGDIRCFVYFVGKQVEG